MISFPNLPTDSLYKFLFVFGIILILASLYFRNQNSQAEKNEMKKELLSDDSISNYWNFKRQALYDAGKIWGETLIKSVHKSSDSVMNNNIDTPLRNMDLQVNQFFKDKTHSKAEIKKFISIKEQSIIKLRKLSNAYSLQLTNKYLHIADQYGDKIKDKANKVDDSAQYSLDMLKSKEKVNKLVGDNSFSIVLSIVLSVGLTFTIIGGILWYIKLQRHLDRILDVQASQMELEHNNKPKITGRIHFEPHNLPRKQVQIKHK